MRPQLTYEAFQHYFLDIFRLADSGVPLSPDQLNFISRHEHVLSSHRMDPVLRYYLKVFKKKPEEFKLKEHERIDREQFQKLYHHANYLLKTKSSNITYQMTPQQLWEFRAVGIHELIFWHGNQFLTGAPFFIGGVPHVIYFQWGNLFGIVKYNVLPDEKALMGNILLYFEDREDRLLDQCVADYNHRLQQDSHLEQQHKLTSTACVHEVLAAEHVAIPEPIPMHK